MEHQIREQQLPCARLCHIIKWDDFDGYGFNLHAEKGRQGQFIGKVDEGSPSEAAGLRKGDRIIEVNDVNITGETHKQVVERIKSLAGETRLLVVDQLADEYFKTNNMPIKGSMPGIRKLRTPDKSPHQLLQEERDAALAAAAAAATAAANNAAPNKHRNGHQNSSMNSDSLSNDSSDHHQQQHHSIHDEYGNGTSRMIHDEDATSVKSSVSGNSKHEQQSATTTMSSPSQLDLSVTDSPNSGAGQGTTMTPSATTLNLAMSAKELRAKLAQRKKYDPKKESLNFKDKFDIVQKL